MAFLELKDKRIAIWGSGVEGQALFRYLRDNYSSKITFIENNEIPLDAEVVFRSPGVSIYKFKGQIEAAMRRGVKFSSLINLFLQELHTPHPCPLPQGEREIKRPKVIAVTGTKGKSTTASLLAFMLNRLGFKVGLGGNIGVAPLELIGQNLDFVVLELSSFQISDLTERVDVAVLLNLSRAHVDWHLTFENYCADKCRLLALADHAVVNYKDEIASSQKFLAMTEKHVSYDDGKGFYVKEGKLFRGGKEVVLPALKIVGEHNLSNLAACLSVLELLGLDYERAVQDLGEFEALAHRLEKVFEKDGLVFVDDSIATVPESVMAAIEAFREQKVAVIIGGYDNGEMDYAKLSEFVENAANVAAAVVLPDTGKFLKTSKAIAAWDMKEAVEKAIEALGGHGVVLLSPAAPSFNMYQNYKERGDDFARLAREV